MARYITQAGVDQSQERLRALEIRLAAIREEKAVALWGSGDGYHDNPAYNQLMQEEQGVAARIVEERQKLAEATIHTVGERPTDRVTLGAILTLTRKELKRGGTETQQWEIVGSGESDMDKNQLGYDTPLGQALLGMSPGETRRITLPVGDVEITLDELHPSWDMQKPEPAKSKSPQPAPGPVMA